MHFIRNTLGPGFLLSTVNASLQIIPGGTWTATNTGKHIQAHGGGILKVGSTYYWVGEDKTDGSSFQNVNCYSSSNLVEWKYEGAILSRQGSGDLGPSRIVERPKIIFNKATNQYVAWMHIDSSDYGDAKVGVATGSSPCGTYTYKGSFRPLNFESRDMGVYVDDDGKGYLLTEDRKNGLRIDLLSDDYLTVKSSTYVWKEKIESPAVIKKNGVYFMFGSKLTGWDPNDNVYSTATSLSGPWSAWKTFADSGSNTYASQTTFILPVGNNFMYMGDRWVKDNLMRSTYIWLPLTISGTSASMKNAVNWVPDVNSGSLSAGPSENSYEGESAQLSGGAKTVSCSGCSGKNSAGYVGGSDNGAVYFGSVSSSASTRTTIRIKHLNGDKSQRFADFTNSKAIVDSTSVTLFVFAPPSPNNPAHQATMPRRKLDKPVISPDLAASKSHSGFLSLPGELRIAIYAWALFPLVDTITIRGVSRPQHLSKTILKPAIFRLNRQIREESLHYLCSNKAFKLLLLQPAIVFLEVIGLTGRRALEVLEILLAPSDLLETNKIEVLTTFLRDTRKLREVRIINYTHSDSRPHLEVFKSKLETAVRSTGKGSDCELYFWEGI
ncbi:carbohydrate-binding module family 35 protein [Aaosphaeria arxii CBS 175.79]|uniref:Carbohydrate-binding module family 35 protein n=1 Tax=Aaosphaeria arxii CBS 175.79 TaxID=1450172 RepID=A0A6A5XK09_9PLEO|nr:carbohydrate-binding module family 35 protein [Aaosphaeria arxii CBS 175.79]KAF2013618.1 carbohydrate-binding module family 35 protein [Aaosphaeria arxii CBS 175.79]